MATPRELTVALQLKADGSGLVGAVKVSKKELESLGVAADRTGKKADVAGRQIEGMGKGSSVAANHFGRLSNQSGALFGALSSLQGIIASIGFAVIANDAVQTIARFQDLDVRIKTLVGSEQKLAEVNDYLNKVAERQSQLLEPLTDRYANLLGLVDAGIIKFQDSQAILEGTNDLMAATGATTEQLGLVMFGLSQALASGTVRAEEFNQVTEPVPGLMAKMEKAAGLAAGQLRKLVNEGKISSELFRQIFIAALKEYEGAAEETAGNINATYRRMQNEYTNLLRALEQPVSAALIPVLEGATLAVETAAPALATLAKNADAAILALGGIVAARTLGPILTTVAGGAVAAASGINLLNVALVGAQAQIALTAAASRGLAAAMALVGGPAGIAILGATALAIYATRTTESELAADAARDATIALRKAMQDGVTTTREAARAAITKAENDLKAAEAALTAAKAERELAIQRAGGLAAYTRGNDANLLGGREVNEVQRRVDDLRLTLAQARKEWIDLIGPTGQAGDALDEAADAASRADAATKALQDQVKKLLEQLDKKKDGTKKATEAEKEFNKALTEAKTLYEQTRTPLEAYNLEVERLARLYASGAFKDLGGIDLVFRGVESAKKRLAEATDTATDAAVKLQEQANPVAEAWEQAGKSINQALAEGLVNGFRDTAGAIKSIFKSLLADLIRLALANPVRIGAALGLTGASSVAAAGPATGGGGLGADSLLSFAPSLISSGLGSLFAGTNFGAGASVLATQGAGALLPNFVGALSQGSIAGALGVAAPVLLPLLAGGLILSKLFSKKPSDKAQGAEIDLVSGAIQQTGDLSGKKFDQGNRDAADSLANSALALVRNLERITGSSADFSIGVKVGSRDGLRGRIGDQIIEGGTPEEFLDRFFDTVVERFGELGETFKTLLQAVEPDRVVEFSGALATLNDYFQADIAADAAEAYRLANRSLFDVFQDQRTAVLDLARAYDGSADSTLQLASATQTLYQLQINLLGQIEQARAQFAATFAATRESLILEQLDPKQRYERLFNQANAQLDVVRTSSDPAEIERAANRAIALFNQATAQLTPEQRGAMLPDLTNWLNEAEALTDERLQKVAEVIEKDSQELKTIIKEEMRAAAADIRAAATEIRAGAAAIPDTINVNSTVTVRQEPQDRSNWGLGYADR